MGSKVLFMGVGLVFLCVSGSGWCSGFMVMGSSGSQSVIPINYGVVQFFGIFTTSQSGGETGARLAVGDINAHNLRMGLPLKVILTEGGGETGCGSKEDPVAIFSRLLLQPVGRGLELDPLPQGQGSSSKPIILAGCQSDCFQFAQAGLKYDAITMCYGGMTSSRGYPHLELTPPTHSSSFDLFMMEPEFSAAVVTPLLKLILHFGWRKVGVLGLVGDSLAQLAEHVSSVLEEHEVQVGRIGGQTFSSETLQLLQNHGFKVVIALVGSEAGGRELFCGISQTGMVTSGGYVWIIVGPKGPYWMTNLASSTPTGSGCRSDQLMLGAEGHLTLSPINWHPDPNFPTLSNRTASGFRKEVMGILGRIGRQGGTTEMVTELDEAPLAYDAVWAAYIAVASFMVENGGSFPAHVDDSMNGVMFHGVSGPVSFHEGRRSVTGVTVRVDQFKSGRYTPIATHFNGNNSWVWTRPAPFGPVTPGDGYGVGDLPLPEFPFWPPSLSEENRPPPLNPEKNSASSHIHWGGRGFVIGIMSLTTFNYGFILLLLLFHSQFTMQFMRK